MAIKGWEYIQVKVILLFVLSLNKKIFEELNENIRAEKKRSKIIVLILGKEILICSLEARVET